MTALHEPWSRHAWGDVWLVNHRDNAAHDTHVPLPPAVLERARRFVHGDDARNHLDAHRALHRVLRARMHPRDPCAGWQVGAHGKPGLRDGPDFNLSRRGPWAAFIVGQVASAGRTALGVDIEPVRMVVDAAMLAKAHFTPRELAAVARGSLLDASRAFLRVWTRKEAAVKAVGLGLSIAPSTFEVGDEGHPVATTLQSSTHRYAVEVESLQHEQVVLAVARVTNVTPV